MYGSADRGGRGGGGDRRMTPRGQMSSGANQRAPLSDLPPGMKIMFEPRPPLEYKPTIIKQKMPPYTGVSAFLGAFEKTPPPERILFETPRDRKIRLRAELKKIQDEKIELLMADYDPHANRNATENAYHTLFVGRLSFDMTEKKLRREFEQYGPIISVRVVTDPSGKPRGYAFIEFEKEDDLTTAYKRADGKKIDGRRIVVDVERGRTVRNWRPRRLGGGLGGRKDKKSKRDLEEEARKAAIEAGEKPRASPYVPPPRPAPASSGGGGSDRGDRDRDRDRERDRGAPSAGGKYGPASRSDGPPDSRYGPSSSTSTAAPPPLAAGAASSSGRRDRSRDRERDRGGGVSSDRKRSRSRSRSRDGGGGERSKESRRR